jgi:hypothetical protein
VIIQLSGNLRMAGAMWPRQGSSSSQPSTTSFPTCHSIYTSISRNNNRSTPAADFTSHLTCSNAPGPKCSPTPCHHDCTLKRRAI